MTPADYTNRANAESESDPDRAIADYDKAIAQAWDLKFSCYVRLFRHLILVRLGRDREDDLL
jgi:hypothetical protein